MRNQILVCFLFTCTWYKLACQTNPSLHVDGDLFVNSALGAIDFGYPNNGDQWHLSTLNGGKDLQLFSKVDGSLTNQRRLIIKQNGRMGLGNITSIDGRFEIEHNSSVMDPHLTITEVGNDYARINFRSTSTPSRYWALAGYTNASATGKFNIYNSAMGDLLSIDGSGNTGINEPSPSARLHIGQHGQLVGTGLRFDDGINLDWDITHGYSLRFHYGGTLKAYIEAGTGAYIQSSDRRLKEDIEGMGMILPKLREIRPRKYHYINTNKRQSSYGFVAQELLESFPELVYYSEVDDVYGVNYGEVGVLAIKAIKELHELVEFQQREIEALKKEIEALK
ncbi:MAG: tail fiber domain-containing protein [Saprospiraceae bacterium]|nr:tail fiber domain-containing protein [Saprospiraceae bacterium]